jgi:predicted DNA-binding protein YlxM (UPF0122 family)
MTKKEQTERLKQMQRLYEEEQLSLREIAAFFGVSWQAIHDRLVRAGVPLRQKSPIKRHLEQDALVKLYTNENLTIGQTAKRLKTNFTKVSEELDRHGIKKRSSGYYRRKYSEIYLLGIGENAVMKRPSVKQSHGAIYAIAWRIGIRISIKSVDKETFQIKRIG